MIGVVIVVWSVVVVELRIVNNFQFTLPQNNFLFGLQDIFMYIQSSESARSLEYGAAAQSRAFII